MPKRNLKKLLDEWIDTDGEECSFREKLGALMMLLWLEKKGLL